MAYSEGIGTGSPAEAEGEPRKRRFVVVAVVAFTVAITAAAVTAPRLIGTTTIEADSVPVMVKPAAVAASADENTISCSGVLSIRATGMKSENTPVEIAVAPAPMTCDGAGATKAGINGAVFTTAGPVKTETGNCHKFSAENIQADLEWITLGEEAKKSKVTIGTFSRDDAKDMLPVIGKVTVEGEFAGAEVAALPRLESATKLKDDIEAQCKPGEEHKNIKAVGAFDVQFTLK
jgi:hypothetical protein